RALLHLPPLPGRQAHPLPGVPAHPHRPRRPGRPLPGAGRERPRRRAGAAAGAARLGGDPDRAARLRHPRAAAGAGRPRLAGGASKAAGLEPRPERREAARAAGAIVPDEQTAPAVWEALDGDGADAVFVATANRAAIADSLHLAGAGGVVQLFAPTPPGEMV